MRSWSVPSRQWIQTAAKLGRPGNSSAVERQELLWRQYFLDPTFWWDYRTNKKSARSPDFRHKESKEPLWLNNFYKPDWVDAKLTSLERRNGRSAQPTSNPLLHHYTGAPTAPECANSQAVNELCADGQLSRAVDALSDLDPQCRVSTSLLYRVIRRCGAEKNLVLGRRLDDLTVKLGYGSNAFLGNHLLRMYACQGRLQEAMEVFKRVVKPDVFMWFSIMSAHVEQGKPSEAIQLYNEMRSSGLEPNSSHIFVAALQACARAEDLETGRQVHADVMESGIPHDSFVCTSLVDMYAKCGDLEEARKVFDSLSTRHVVTWTAMINGYAEHGLGPQALALYARMEQEGLILADSVTFACLLKACASAGALQQGRQLHSGIVERGLLEGDLVLGNCLVNMYAKCGQLEEAMEVFKKMAKPNVFIWVSIISAHAEQGKPCEAIVLYNEMRRSSLEPNGHIFVAALQACVRADDVESGRQVHADVLESCMQHNTFVCNCLVDMYAKCGELEDARRVFDSMATRNAVTWNAMITGYAKCGKLEDARKLFDSLATRDAVTWNAMINGYAEHGLGPQALALYARMQQEGLILADSFTFACLLKACASVGALQQGRQLHSEIVERGLLEGDIVLGNSLVTMYSRCGELEDARKVFDSLSTRDAVTWTAMINGYAEQGLGPQALTLYATMEQEGVILANSVTYGCLLKACASAGALQQGRQLHSGIVERGLLEADIVLGTCLVNMYAKCGQLEDARKVFDSLSTRDAVTWNAMINGYAEHGLGAEALALYVRMEQEGLTLADSATFACLLKACTSAGGLQQGRQLHSEIVERGLLGGDIVLGNCLVNMYAKCGQLEDASEVFDNLSTRDAVTWNAMINGYGRNSEGHKATACFEDMILAGIQPNDTTFTCLLAACSQEGLVSEGRQYFDAMVKQHGLNPTAEHYNCMVDLLGRAGHLGEAEKMLFSIGYEHDAVGLMSLLNACKIHGDIERGTRCYERLVELDPQHAAAYVLMANMYADADRWADVDRIERLRKLAGANKKPAVAGIEVNKQVHTFVVGEERGGDLSCKVRSTNERLKEEGNHVPQTNLVLKPVSEKEKEDQLCGHAEKLALAFGLWKTPDGTPLLVTKNLRMCSDCHSSTEIMSRVEKRDIVVRDAHRVHRFEAGSCSCNGRH